MSDNHQRYRSIRTALSQMFLTEPAIPNLKRGEAKRGTCGKLTGKNLSEQADYLCAIDFGQYPHWLAQTLGECARCAQAEQ